MINFLFFVSSVAALTGFTFASPVDRDAAPAVKLSYGSFQGQNTGNVSEFLGVPFAAAPTGNLRFAPPQPPTPFEGVRQATQYGAACLQQTTAADTGALPFKLPSIIHPIPGAPGIVNSSEDCLFINVVKPATADSKGGLPVLLWFFGGAFETGDSSSFPGAPIVERSIVLGEPVIFVSANYRLHALGFLAGKEALAANATNLGLRDQRLAMEWVHEYISDFGGDPSKVIIWGESAGAESIGLHYLINNGTTDLFRGGFMESGSPYTLKTVEDGQQWYDHLVEYTACGGNSDTFECLRQAPIDQLMAAANSTPSYINYTSLNLAWFPRVDGNVIARNPVESLQMGLYSKAPFVNGDCDDEGTIFSLANLNITTDEEFANYIHTNYLPTASDEQIAVLADVYPANPALGSPFGTGDMWNISAQYKRLASFQGDLQFQVPRRFFMSIASATQPTWSYLYKRGKSEPVIGTYHASDIAEFFTDIDYIGMDALINFAHSLNPNAPSGLPQNISYLSDVHWPQYGSSLIPSLLTFWDPAPTVNITLDTFRAVPIEVLTLITLALALA
ncbi:hypothetical protein POSPLADRAFT_1065829 [Postia placenta MAD-698-R-SB12]|uniref:Carboxylic ester hydrolase n=1 Tax=Postia placenta MAD-698-R-SB12 TaxID=670580 RepID=A0A1X6N1S3_9APHY|nr:hypothetical protein POSPLADRAFT_1065829 [Postia placenta MAD-698-R-SB12]OSX62581.1 hypothetical protein POSPLADRAFT_1065829 [Postia placenta MAD-698-R-SB12]